MPEALEQELEESQRRQELATVVEIQEDRGLDWVLEVLDQVAMDQVELVPDQVAMGLVLVLVLGELVLEFLVVVMDLMEQELAM